MTRQTRLIGFIAGFALLSIFAVGQGFLRMQAAAEEQAITGASRQEADLVVVTFSSAWCGPCKILKPRLADVKPEFKNSNVRFVELNFTFGENENFSSLAADEGFVEIYNRYKNATGFSVLVNKHNGEVLDVLTADYSVGAMRGAILRGIAIVKAG